MGSSRRPPDPTGWRRTCYAWAVSPERSCLPRSRTPAFVPPENSDPLPLGDSREKLNTESEDFKLRGRRLRRLRNLPACRRRIYGDNSRFCLAKLGAIYVVYLPNGGGAELDLSDVVRTFDVAWFSPLMGGPLVSGAVTTVTGPGRVELGSPPTDPGQDWAVLVPGR